MGNLQESDDSAADFEGTWMKPYVHPWPEGLAELCLKIRVKLRRWQLLWKLGDLLHRRHSGTAAPPPDCPTSPDTDIDGTWEHIDIDVAVETPG